MLHKAIKGFEDYLITDTGRVYSLKKERYLKPQPTRYEYLQVVLCKSGKTCAKYVHRLVAEAFIENPENKPTVDHINRIRTDNRVENLRWANSKEQRENSCATRVHKENRGTPIIEVINDEVSVGYLSLNEVPNIYHEPIRKHIIKAETEFTIKQRNGNVRQFILPPKQKIRD